MMDPWLYRGRGGGSATLWRKRWWIRGQLLQNRWPQSQWLTATNIAISVSEDWGHFMSTDSSSRNSAAV